MAYDLNDITELIRYHLVLAEPTHERAGDNLIRLVGEIERMATGPLWRSAEWVFCDRCKTSVDTDLIDPDGHHYSDDGYFYCADCWDADGEPTVDPAQAGQ